MNTSLSLLLIPVIIIIIIIMYWDEIVNSCQGVKRRSINFGRYYNPIL